MMHQKVKFQIIVVSLLLATIALQGCSMSGANIAETQQQVSTPGIIPTWTPRPEDLTLTALPTATLLAPVSATETGTPTSTEPPPFTPTPKTVTVTIEGGNLSVRRGPSLDYNYIGALYDGETAVASGRDRISRWIRVKFPSEPDREGWITTETKYTNISGDISNLPFIETEPANPAFIRNCTKHEIWIMPADVYLLSKFDEPYNEEQFGVGVYQVYDTDIPGNVRLDDIDLSEGERVDIRFDGNGEKSKCE